MGVHYCTMREAPLFPEFKNEHRYWGVDHPIQMDLTPESPFLLIQAEEEGLYVGCHDTAVEERTEFTFQRKPGYGKVGYVPECAKVVVQPVHMEFMVTHLPFVQPGETVALAPIVIKPYTGDWHAGADIYREWRKTWMTKPPVPGRSASYLAACRPDSS